MKRWVTAVMLLSLFGSFASPFVATAVETSESSTNGSISSNNATINSVSSDPQQTVPTESAPVPEKTESSTKNTASTESSEKPAEIKNSLEFVKDSNFVDKEATNEQVELDLLGKVTSSAENAQAVNFEMTKAFTLADSKDEEKVILNEQKEPIGKYTVDTSGNRVKYSLNFNKLVKGENRFRLVLLGTITRGPDKSVNVYQDDQEIFQLALPEEAKAEASESSSSAKSEATTETSAAKESTSKSIEKTKESTEESTTSTKATETKKAKKAIKAQAEEPRAAGPIDDLFAQYAPGDNLVKAINLNFDPNPPTINSTVKFSLDFAIPEAVRTEMVSGDYYEMDFPEGLTIGSPSPSGELTDTDGVVYGNYIFDAATQKLRITFTQEDGVNYLPPEGGNVNVEVRFDTKKITQPGPTTIVYPSKTNIPPLTINIKPTGGTSISKAGHTDKPNNPSKVYWDVDFNKDFAELDGPLVLEHFPDQVTFNKDDMGAVTVYPLDVDFNGNVTGTEKMPIDPSTYSVTEDGSIQFSSKIDRPYRIVYSTTIKDSAKPTDGGTIPVTNKATLVTGPNKLDASATVQLNYKKALEKIQTGYDRVGQEYSWLIRYNYGQKELADDTVVSDTYSSNMDVEADSFNLYTVNFDDKGNPVNGAPLNPKDYSINTETNPFTVTFKNNVQAGKAINIAYKTKVNAVVANSNPVTVTNEAKTNNLPPTTQVTTNPSQQVVIKNKPTVDVGTKTAHYVIDINKNKYEIENTLFTDTMSYTEQGYANIPTKVKVPSQLEDAGVIIRDITDNNRILTGAFRLISSTGEDRGGYGDPETADYYIKINVTPDQSGYKNFTIKFQNGYAKTSHQFQMEYYVAYNQFNQNTPNPNTSIDYKNTMTANFTNNGKPYTSSSSTDFKTSTQEANQGVKKGSYNPVTKEITWTIIANYNNLGLSVLGLTDPITGNQVYKPDSLNVTRGKIDNKGNFQATTDAAYSGNQVGKDYLKVTNPNPTGEDAQGTLALEIGSKDTLIPGWDKDGTPMVFQIQFKTSLQGKIVYDQSTYTNTATTDVEGVEQQLTASVSIAFGGKSAVKTGNYNTQTGLINWQLDINPNQSLLSNVTIQDTPSSNQILQESFKLYTGKYSGSGSSTTVQPDQQVPSDQYKVKVTTDPATGQQSFTVDMSGIEEKADPNNEGQFLKGVIEKPYVLVYDTQPNFTSKTETVTNNASIASEGRQLPGKDTQKNINVTIQESSGTAYGTKGKIAVLKVDGNGSIVAGAVLQLLRKNIKTDKTDVLYQTTTNSQGMAAFGNLIATSSNYEYYVKEIEAPDGYTISPELLKGEKVSVSTESSTPVTMIENEPVKVLFNKTDANGKRLAGGLFILSQNNGTKDAPNYVVLRAITPTTQGFDLSGLPDGTYRIQEAFAPDGYQNNLTSVDFEVKKETDNTRHVFVNDKVVSDGTLQLKDYQGSAVLEKTDESGKKLANAQFNLQRAELNSDDYSEFGDQSTYVTNSNGKLNLKNLAPGKYKLKESQAPEGYYLNSREFSFVVDPVSTNDQAPATIQLNDGDPLIDYQGSARFKKVDGHDYLVDQKETPLDGAKFQLYDASGKSAIGAEITSGSDGYFTFEDLEPGTTYAIKETKAPDGYIKNEQLIRFTTPVTNNQGESAVTIDSEKQKIVVDEKTPFKNYKEGAHFQKIDQAGQALGDAKYQLFKQNSSYEWQQITEKKNGAGEDGFFTSDKLDGSVNAFELSPGDYKFVEKTAPNGYLLNTKEIPFTVEAQDEGDPLVLEIPIKGDANVNYQGSAQLYKEAEEASGNDFSKLEGARFDVYTDAEKPQKVTKESLQSDSDGNITATGLAPGNYYFQEVSNDKKYVINTEKIKFTIPAEAAGKPEMVTSNADGKLALKNYLGSVELTKVDANDQPLPNAEFAVYTKDEKVATGTSDPEGKVTIDKLAPGDYTLKETKAPENYLINDQSVAFTIPDSAEGQPQKVVIPEHFVNYQGSIKLIKSDEQGQPLENAEFQLLKDGKPLDQTVTSNPKGEVVFDHLAPGEYTFKEITPPNGYLLNTTTVSVTVPEHEEGQPTVVTAKDNFINYQGTAELTKTDGAGNNLQGAKFKIVDADGKDVEGKTATSDANGLVQVTGLAPGEYRFVETEAPDIGTAGKYIMTSQDLDFEIPAENEGKPAVVNVSKQVKNYRGEIRLHKVGSDLKADSKTINLAGAEFSLYTKEDFSDTDPVKVTSDADGLVAFKDLAPGTYYVKETTAPKGYLLNTFPVTFVIPERVPETLPQSDAQNHSNKIETDKDTDIYVVDAGDFQNGRKEIEVKKTDGESNGNLDLKKVAFTLYFDNGTTAGKLVKEDLQPEADGKVDLSNLALEDGSYKLVETRTAPNYVVSSKPIYFVVENKQAKGLSLDLANYQAAIKGRKVSGEKKLAGAEYELFNAADLAKSIKTTDKNGDSQTIIKTDSEGLFYAKGLGAGEYVLKEVKAPSGYILDTTEHKFTIRPQAGKPAAQNLGNFENYQGSVELTKVDSANANKHLSGAEFQLLDHAQKVLQNNLKTNSEGKLTVKDLAPGKYAFKETKAPTGYQLSEKTIEFTVAEAHKGKPTLLKVVAKNQVMPKQPNRPNRPSRPNAPGQGFYPKTGEAKGITLLVLGGIIILAVIGIVYIRKRR